MGNKVSLEENLIDLRIVSKQMVRSSAKCEKNQKAALAKLKKVSVHMSYIIMIGSRTELPAEYIPSLFPSYFHMIFFFWFFWLHRRFNKVIRKVHASTDKMRYGKRIRHSITYAWRVDWMPAAVGLKQRSE